MQHSTVTDDILPFQYSWRYGTFNDGQYFSEADQRCAAGFLQWGSANFPPSSMARLLQTAFKAIIVVPAYRLNALGFLSGHELQAEARTNKETVGNLGFWDQRLALEWTSDNISAFNGNPKNITIAGYSAGSHSTFQQLAHELYFVSDRSAIIKRAIMWSNSPGGKNRFRCCAPKLM